MPQAINVELITNASQGSVINYWQYFAPEKGDLSIKLAWEHDQSIISIIANIGQQFFFSPTL